LRGVEVTSSSRREKQRRNETTARKNRFAVSNSINDRISKKGNGRAKNKKERKRLLKNGLYGIGTR